MNKFLIKGILVDPHSNEAIKDERIIRIEPKTMELLNFLVINAGRTVTKDEIFQNVWPGIIVSEDSITRCISQLRKVLDDDPLNPLIETISKRGYRVKAPVEFLGKGVKNSGIIMTRGNMRRVIVSLLAAIIAGAIALGSVYGVGSIMYGQGIAIILAAFTITFAIFYYWIERK